MRKLLLIVPAVAVIAATTPAAAEGHTWRIGRDSFNVHFEGLDLQATSGRAEALRRIETAAARLCREVRPRSDRDACRARVVAQATWGPAGRMVRTALAERRQAAWTKNAAR